MYFYRVILFLFFWWEIALTTRESEDFVLQSHINIKDNYFLTEKIETLCVAMNALSLEESEENDCAFDESVQYGDARFLKGEDSQNSLSTQPYEISPRSSWDVSSSSSSNFSDTVSSSYSSSYLGGNKSRSSYSFGRSTWVKGYFRKDGTYVSGHVRRSKK